MEKEATVDECSGTGRKSIIHQWNEMERNRSLIDLSSTSLFTLKLRSFFFKNNKFTSLSLDINYTTLPSHPPSPPPPPPLISCALLAETETETNMIFQSTKFEISWLFNFPLAAWWAIQARSFSDANEWEERKIIVWSIHSSSQKEGEIQGVLKAKLFLTPYRQTQHQHKKSYTPYESIALFYFITIFFFASWFPFSLYTSNF